MKIVVAIATAGRPEVLGETLRELGRQRRLADEIVICPSDPSDLPQAATDFPAFSTVSGRRGGSPQRNAILDSVVDADIVVFFDDDFFPAPGYLAAIEAAFIDPTIAVVSGKVLADDVLGPGLTPAEARAVLAQDDLAKPALESIEPRYNGYGCNMAVRNSVLRDHAIRFDERLPLYSWLEDVDISRRIAPYGAIVWNPTARGVHLGSKRGRSPGLRLGYSQVANPFYLWRKGTMRGDKALAQVVRNIMANVVKIARSEPWVDRRGRAAGNALALFDLVTGRISPERVLALDVEARASVGATT